MGATLAGAVLVAAASPSIQAPAALALLEPTVPSVAVRHAGRPFSLATEAMALHAGDGVRTDATGRALITYADGTTLALGPGSELVIESLQRNGRDLFVLINQTAGRVWYQLARSLSPAARYEVRSGALAAVVRAGSTVEVAVTEDGTSVTAVEGSAEATVGGTTVTVPAGTTTTVAAGDAASPAAGDAASPTPSASPTYAPATLRLEPIPLATEPTAETSASPSPTPVARSAASAGPTASSSAWPTPTRSSAPPATPTSSSAPTPSATAAPGPASTPKPRPSDPQPDRGRDDEQRARRLGAQDPSSP